MSPRARPALFTSNILRMHPYGLVTHVASLVSGFALATPALPAPFIHDMTPSAQEADNGSDEPAYPGARSEASMRADRGTTINSDMSSGPSKVIYASPHEIRTAYGLDKSRQTVRTSLLRKSAGDNPISDELRILVRTVFNPLA